MSGIGTRYANSGVNLVTTAETAAVTVPFSPGVALNKSLASPAGVTNPPDYVLQGTVNVTAGAGTTSIQIRCRQGNNTITGPQVGTTRNETLAAGATQDFAFNFGDAGGLSGQPYTITVQQVGATGNGTVNSIGGTVEDYT